RPHRRRRLSAAGSRSARRRRAVGRRRRRQARGAGGGDLRHLRSRQRRPGAALRRLGASPDRCAGADRFVLRLRRGAVAPPRLRSGQAAPPQEGHGDRMTQPTAYLGARIFDGERWHDDAALISGAGGVEGIVAADAVGDRPVERLDGGLLVPGFVDLQVNGGGGALVDEETTLETLQTICATYYQFGTTALLPTLNTNTREVTQRVIDAGIAAAEARIP